MAFGTFKAMNRTNNAKLSFAKSLRKFFSNLSWRWSDGSGRKVVELVDSTLPLSQLAALKAQNIIQF